MRGCGRFNGQDRSIEIGFVEDRSKITQPSDGSIHMGSTMASLLEVRLAFIRLISRENVYFNGSTTCEQEGRSIKVPGIVDFSEVERSF
ncbi:hypothetical protein H6798_01015 [Candidatus Nomurabacteria bacterium]|nr:hypothetical protein [Candidatus Nomurabacteria bacterium]